MIFADCISPMRRVSPWRILDDPAVVIDGDFAGAHVVLEIRKDDGTARAGRVIDAPGAVHARVREPIRWRLEGGSAATRVTVAGIAAIFPPIVTWSRDRGHPRNEHDEAEALAEVAA